MWYFNCGHTACGGLKSNFHESLSGNHTQDWEPSDADLDAVARERRMRGVMSQLTLQDRHILSAFYTFEEERCCPTLRIIYSEYLNVIRLQHTREELLNIKLRKDHDELLAQAKRSVKNAIKAFREASQ